MYYVLYYTCSTGGRCTVHCVGQYGQRPGTVMHSALAAGYGQAYFECGPSTGMDCWCAHGYGRPQ